MFYCFARTMPTVKWDNCHLALDVAIAAAKAVNKDVYVCWDKKSSCWFLQNPAQQHVAEVEFLVTPRFALPMSDNAVHIKNMYLSRPSYSVTSDMLARIVRPISLLACYG